MLEAAGCTLMQGNLFGRPMPVAEFERLLDARADTDLPLVDA
jgi:EAL domain-containing protein (putative c-di-GMP-specific phosphodiesterase class I)